MRVYLAASSNRIDELNHRADALRWAGHVVEIGHPEHSSERNSAVWRSDVVVLLTDVDDHGASTALSDTVDIRQALAVGKPMFLVGPGCPPHGIEGDLQHFSGWGRGVLDALQDLW